MSLAKLYKESLAVRALAIASAVGWLAAILLGAALWVQSARHSVAQAALTQARAAHAAAVTSAGEWEATAGRMRQAVDQCNAQRLADRERDRRAIEAAQAAQRDADRTLRAWLDRYAAATRSAECAAIERLQICEVP